MPPKKKGNAKAKSKAKGEAEKPAPAEGSANAQSGTKQGSAGVEKRAAKHVEEFKYNDQHVIAAGRIKNPAQDTDRVYVRIRKQEFNELYNRRVGSKQTFGFNVAASRDIPKGGLDRRVFMACCSSAEDYFTYPPAPEFDDELDAWVDPDPKVLPLPLCYPRFHLNGKDEQDRGYDGYVEQMAHIRADEIVKFIFPWLKKMEEAAYNIVNDTTRKIFADKFWADQGANPLIEIPDELLEKIHLYNAMLQLGIPFFFQRELIDALVAQMHDTDLKNCHLDTVEMTIGRFYSRGVPALDPVLNHLIGEYAFRSNLDENFPEPSSELKLLDKTSDDEVDTRPRAELYLPKGEIREWLEYKDVPAGREDYPEDTMIVPPKLEVLGHAIRHWSGVRRRGKKRARPAYGGYPLNVGRVSRWYSKLGMEESENGELNKDYSEFNTYRLRDVTKRPGEWPVGDGAEDASVEEE